MNKLILIFLTILIASCSTVDSYKVVREGDLVIIEAIGGVPPSQTNFIEGSTLSAIVDRHGPPRSVVTRDAEVSMTYFVWIYKKPATIFPPTLWFESRIERYVLKFDSNDRLVGQTSVFLTGNIPVLVAGTLSIGNYPAMEDSEFKNVGNFLLSKGIFFNGKVWYQQNRKRVFFQLLQSGEIPCWKKGCPKNST